VAWGAGPGAALAAPGGLMRNPSKSSSRSSSASSGSSRDGAGGGKLQAMTVGKLQAMMGGPAGVGASAGFTFSKPRALTCYLCGQGYGTASLPIHLPRCEQLWVDRESAKPPGEPRRPLPPRPPALAQPLPRTPEAIDRFNEAMGGAYNRRALVPCAHCGRTFLEAALARHQKCCTAASPMGRTAAGGAGSAPASPKLARQGQQQQQQHTESGSSSGRGGRGRGGGSEAPAAGLLPCKHCGRTFSAAAHEKHERVCANVFGAKKQQKQAGVWSKA